MGNHAVLFILMLCCLLCSVQEGDDLGAGAGVVRREAAVTCAVGDAVCYCPVDGIIIVTSPQELVSMIVAKAVNMAKLMNIPVLGIVENMSYFKCPDCGKEHEIFGASRVDAVAKEFGIGHTARLPIDPVISTMVDAGEIESISADALDALADFIEKGDSK